jgi:kynurenine formamidase
MTTGSAARRARIWGILAQPPETRPPFRPSGRSACSSTFQVTGGVDCLGRGEAVSADELKAIARSNKVELQRADVALVCTGYLSHWPDVTKLEAHRGAGPDLSAARWFADCGIVACGSDTETFEVQPSLAVRPAIRSPSIPCS